MERMIVFSPGAPTPGVMYTPGFPIWAIQAICPGARSITEVDEIGFTEIAGDMDRVARIERDGWTITTYVNWQSPQVLCFEVEARDRNE
jgi:hypothetical protein